MPKIKLPDGSIYRYKFHALYPGIKQINKEIASENLSLLKKIFNNHDIYFQLTFGTLLGIIRDNDFIEHDEDIDIALLDESRNKFLSLLPELRKSGFELCRYDRRSLYSLMRNGEYIDLYFFKTLDSVLSECSGCILKTEHLVNSKKIYFNGDEYLIPEKYEECLVGAYGKSWKIPLKWNNYSQSKYKITLFKLKAYIRLYLPNFIFYPVIYKIEKKNRAIRIARLRQNGVLDYRDSK